MATNKRITNLNDYLSVLPYASEMFGVYQPLIGWKSKRVQDRIQLGLINEKSAFINRLAKNLTSQVQLNFNQDCFITASHLEPADYTQDKQVERESILLQEIGRQLKEQGQPKTHNAWKAIINSDRLTDILKTTVLEYYNALSIRRCQEIAAIIRQNAGGFNEVDANTQRQRLLDANRQVIEKSIKNEAILAGVLVKLLDAGILDQLHTIFYAQSDKDYKHYFFDQIKQSEQSFKDPFLTFDPNQDIKNVSLSPLGIVHLFRQYFFELDTFLGTPVGHVWLSPGSSVELIEVSTRKITVEKSVELSTETSKKQENSVTDQDEISEAVKHDNKDDLKLGVTTTVNQSWGTGSASASGSLNMDKTQQVAREQTHKRMRQQSEKLTEEIKQNYKITFKTVTETSDTSSKRYVLSNNTQNLINYELRRKMRQVGVQVQDIGTYLCWETFVDEPGQALGLANLVHIAKPADLAPLPEQHKIDYPPAQIKSFQTNAVWDYGDDRRFGFVPVGLYQLPAPPDGFELEIPATNSIPVFQVSGSGEDFHGTWAFEGRFVPGGLSIGVITESGGMSWDERIDFVVAGGLTYVPNAAKRKEIDDANKNTSATDAVNRENAVKTREVYLNAAKERIEMASNIVGRKYEDLREEERIIVYRNLISSLMTGTHYQNSDKESRHILSELINSIFDVDKMLYFVAPEWWKPRQRPATKIEVDALINKDGESIMSWSDYKLRQDNYLITDKSKPAPMGSSLGWLLQLDGDNLRNAFLNAPWVKAVIPIRPGKEQSAINWLKNVKVEGADGLEALYDASEDELAEIRTGLEKAPGAPVSINDAITYLCKKVAIKHEEANSVKKYPETEIHDDQKVSSTPIEKVYEHGFYPLQGGFRLSPAAPNPDPNNTDSNFQVFDQWIEVLPTDQVVPVEVRYDSKTGRQL